MPARWIHRVGYATPAPAVNPVLHAQTNSQTKHHCLALPSTVMTCDAACVGQRTIPDASCRLREIGVDKTSVSGGASHVSLFLPLCQYSDSRWKMKPMTTAKPAPRMTPNPTMPHSVSFTVPLTVSLKAAKQRHTSQHA